MTGLRTRVGIDLVAVEQVTESIRAHGDRYLQRVYTETELRDCRDAAGAPDPAGLAARFAAKEALLKALRADRASVPWGEIGVCRDASGAPELALTGGAAALAARRGVEALDVSLTHEGPFAAAIVVAQVRAD